MARPRKYAPELLDRGARVVIESGRPIAHVARDLGVPAETLRRHVRRVEADEGCVRRLEGEKLRGGWTLHRSGGDGPKAQWLVMKRRDEGADARRNPQSTQPEFMLSGRTVEQVAAGG